MALHGEEAAAAATLNRFFWKKMMRGAKMHHGVGQQGPPPGAAQLPSKMESVARLAKNVDREERRVYAHNRRGDLDKEAGGGIFENMQQQKLVPQRARSPGATASGAASARRARRP